MEIEEALFDQYMIIPISLQVLVENVYKHNEFSIYEPLEIEVALDGDRVRVRNRIARKEISHDSPKVGLANLDERCKLVIGAPLEVRDTGVEFSIYLPIVNTD